MFFLDPLFLLISIPALVFGLWAQFKVQKAFKKYVEVRSSVGLTGAQVARRVLDSSNLHHVQIELAQGFLSDHYDPRAKALRLSSDVYNGVSLAASGVAAHEAGHAMQDQQGYFALRVRSAMVPTVQIGSWIGPILFTVGIFTVPLFGATLAWLGLILFAATTLFTWVTLPVEFDASRRAKQVLSTQGLIRSDEMPGVNKVLDAAALTYVAAAVQAVSTLLYYGLLMSGLSREES